MKSSSSLCDLVESSRWGFLRVRLIKKTLFQGLPDIWLKSDRVCRSNYFYCSVVCVFWQRITYLNYSLHAWLASVWLNGILAISRMSGMSSTLNVIFIDNGLVKLVLFYGYNLLPVCQQDYRTTTSPICWRHYTIALLNFFNQNVHCFALFWRRFCSWHFWDLNTTPTLTRSSWSCAVSALAKMIALPPVVLSLLSFFNPSFFPLKWMMECSPIVTSLTLQAVLDRQMVALYNINFHYNHDITFTQLSYQLSCGFIKAYISVDILFVVIQHNKVTRKATGWHNIKQFNRLHG